MRHCKHVLIASMLIASLTFIAVADDLPLDKVSLPAGFKIDVYATDIPNARSMALGEKGTLFVGSRKAGNVYALVDEDKNFKVDKVFLIAQGLNMPNGVAFKDGDLYVAEIQRVIKFPQIESSLENPPQPVLVSDKFPSDPWHGWKYIQFGPDGKLYVPNGAPCNVCTRMEVEFSTILRMDPDGSDLEVFVHGIRNSVGFDWHPKTKELWFTDNGRDMLGDDIPPDELNYAPRMGMHFGFPYCHGEGIIDPEFGELPCDSFTAPAQSLGPHVAALGLKFYSGKMFPEEYQDQIFIAEHGSWNRKNKIGYRVSLVKLKGNKPVQYTDFAKGWLQGESAWGRPVALLILPDGSMLVSDDFANVIYRISYESKPDKQK